MHSYENVRKNYSVANNYFKWFYQIGLLTKYYSTLYLMPYTFNKLKHIPNYNYNSFIYDCWVTEDNVQVCQIKY